MDVDKLNIGEKCESFWRVRVVDNFFLIEICLMFFNFSFRGNIDGFIELIFMNEV